MAMFNPVTQKNSAIPSAQVVDDSGEKKKKKTSFNRKKCLAETGLRRAAIYLEQLGWNKNYRKGQKKRWQGEK